jgi:hypothetical protein
MGYPAQQIIRRTGKARSKLQQGKAQHKKIARRTVRGLQRIGQGYKGSVTRTEFDFARPLGEEMHASRVDDQADVIGGVTAHERPPVARALQPARQNLNAREPLQPKVNLNRVIVHEVGVVPDSQAVEELRRLFAAAIGSRQAQSPGEKDAQRSQSCTRMPRPLL